MKYIAEKERKFIDSLSMKIYHTIYPISEAPGSEPGSALYALDNKIILPTGEKITQNPLTGNKTLAFIMLEGHLIFTDNNGFKHKLSKDDAIIIGARICIIVTSCRITVKVLMQSLLRSKRQ
ncbi:hypothetical protein [Pedobacter sp.]|uniref:hypothetical protein n=1 Tax=Pedobacter sp. TaxID=1411316 RepID=UPI003C32FBD7